MASNQKVEENRPRFKFNFPYFYILPPKMSSEHKSLFFLGHPVRAVVVIIIVTYCSARETLSALSRFHHYVSWQPVGYITPIIGRKSIYFPLR